jgi:hypothetical protein
MLPPFSVIGAVTDKDTELGRPGAPGPPPPPGVGLITRIGAVVTALVAIAATLELAFACWASCDTVSASARSF